MRKRSLLLSAQLILILYCSTLAIGTWAFNEVPVQAIYGQGQTSAKVQDNIKQSGYAEEVTPQIKTITAESERSSSPEKFHQDQALTETFSTLVINYWKSVPCCRPVLLSHTPVDFLYPFHFFT